MALAIDREIFQDAYLAHRAVDLSLAPSTWHLQIVGKRDGLSDARRYA
jgi:hypothetical protein